MSLRSSYLIKSAAIPIDQAIRILLAITGRDRTWLVGDPEVPDEAAARFRVAVERRRSGEPLQYIEGTVQFGPIELRTTPAALIPRPETERLWEICLGKLGDVVAPVIVDLCTGSGNLALAFCHALPAATVYAADRSPAAIELAEENASDLGLDAHFLLGDLFAPLPGDLRRNVDLIVANPPYVSDTDYRNLPDEVASYEPETALVAGPDGLEVLRRIAAEAIDWLRPGGLIACEIGETQGEACLALFAAYQPQIQQDLAGRDRFVLGTAPMLRDVH